MFGRSHVRPSSILASNSFHFLLHLLHEQEVVPMSEFDNPAVTEPPDHSIYTDRLLLRTLRVSDAQRLMPILTSKHVMQWTVKTFSKSCSIVFEAEGIWQTKPPVEDIAQAERWIKDRALGQDVFNFVIELRGDAQGGDAPIVGVAGTFHVPKIGYLIHPEYWGKGIASEALSALVPAIFERFPSSQQVAEGRSEHGAGLDHVEGWIDVENAASRRVLEKCGFAFCEEMNAPDDAPGHVSRVAVLRRARPGTGLGEMGLVRGQDHADRPVPPVQ